VRPKSTPLPKPDKPEPKRARLEIRTEIEIFFTLLLKSFFIFVKMESTISKKITFETKTACGGNYVKHVSKVF
jgi:hypothetical protein